MVDRQGGQWTLTETQDVKALMAKSAQVCRDSGILGVTDPDTGAAQAAHVVANSL